MSSPSSATALAATLRQDQRRRWRGGERPLAEEYLARHPELLGDAEAALDLIFNEFLLREELGESPGVDEYRRRFPEQAEVLAAQIGLHRAVAGEATIEGLPGPPPSPASQHWPRVAGYEVLAELGRGGMGVVYKARHLALNRLVALKCVLAGSAADAGLLVRVRQEAELAARLHHPNVVQIHEVGLHDGSPYLALELVDGPNLAQLLGGGRSPGNRRPGGNPGSGPRGGPRQGDRAPRSEAGERADGDRPRGAVGPGDQAQIARGPLRPPRLHAQGRRLRHGQAASTPTPGIPSAARPGARRRTPRSRPGARRRTVGVAADVYALGSILYECLTGRPPFQAATVLETLEQVCSQDPFRRRSFNPASRATSPPPA
ncbi:MAG: protein kinase [Gemmataceae bacterium]